MFFDTFACFLERFLIIEFGLGEELVGKTYDLFLKTDRKHISVRDRQIALHDSLQ